MYSNLEARSYQARAEKTTVVVEWPSAKCTKRSISELGRLWWEGEDRSGSARESRNSSEGIGTMSIGT